MKDIINRLKTWFAHLPFVIENYKMFYGIPKQENAAADEVKQKYYTDDAPKAANDKKQVIFMADGRTRHGGLSDRLRGLITTYSACKELGYDYRVHFVQPFELSDFLQPNTYDWRIAPEEICYNSQDVSVIKIASSNHAMDPIFSYWRMKRNLKKDFRQIHVYSNILLPERKRAERESSLFNELFKPAPALQAKLDEYSQAIGGKYCSASFRFQQLLGDFEDDGTMREWPTLAPSEQQVLMNACIRQLKALRERENIDKILVAGDSVKFLEYAQEQLDFVYVIPGQTMHIDVAGQIPFEVNLKTFVDLLMISRAQKAFLFQTGEMYRSYFPRLASELGGIPFEFIQF